MDSEWDVSWWVLIWLSLSFVSDVGYVARVGVVNAVGHNLKFKVVFNSFLLFETSKTWFYKLPAAKLIKFEFLNKKKNLTIFQNFE